MDRHELAIFPGKICFIEPKVRTNRVLKQASVSNKSIVLNKRWVNKIRHKNKESLISLDTAHLFLYKETNGCFYT
jgi:hypothetical protein